MKSWININPSMSKQDEFRTRHPAHPNAIRTIGCANKKGGIAYQPAWFGASPTTLSTRLRHDQWKVRIIQLIGVQYTIHVRIYSKIQIIATTR